MYSPRFYHYLFSNGYCSVFCNAAFEMRTYAWDSFEQLTNNLQKKLEEVRREKATLETHIEHEKKANTTLRLQLSELRNSQIAKSIKLERQDEMEEE